MIEFSGRCAAPAGIFTIIVGRGLGSRWQNTDYDMTSALTGQECVVKLLEGWRSHTLKAAHAIKPQRSIVADANTSISIDGHCKLVLVSLLIR